MQVESNVNVLSVRELQKEDIEYIVQYWLDSESSHLVGMGVDLSKLPTRNVLTNMLIEQLNQPIAEKQSYCIIWEVDGQAVGHCNINKIVPGKEAYMHLHLWRSGFRKRGVGTSLVKMSLPFFFENFKLKQLFCEPYVLNPAPNKTLKKVGFTFSKKHVTIPGSLNFEQEVNLWVLSEDDFHAIQLK